MTLPCVATLQKTVSGFDLFELACKYHETYDELMVALKGLEKISEVNHEASKWMLDALASFLKNLSVPPSQSSYPRNPNEHEALQRNRLQPYQPIIFMYQEFFKANQDTLPISDGKLTNLTNITTTQGARFQSQKPSKVMWQDTVLAMTCVYGLAAEIQHKVLEIKFARSELQALESEKRNKLMNTTSTETEAFLAIKTKMFSQEAENGDKTTTNHAQMKSESGVMEKLKNLFFEGRIFGKQLDTTSAASSLTPGTSNKLSHASSASSLEELELEAVASNNTTITTKPPSR